ncbi:MAG: hypothetical protein KQJ78_05960 [Deltaproteobacteria bacterium]|nr:hypothetical protein [Deltaproteobacteria bacterium]
MRKSIALGCLALLLVWPLVGVGEASRLAADLLGSPLATEVIRSLFPDAPEGWEAEDPVFDKQLTKGGKWEASRLYHLAACAPGEVEVIFSTGSPMLPLVRQAFSDPQTLATIDGGQVIEHKGHKAVLAVEGKEVASLFVPLGHNGMVTIEADAVPKAMQMVQKLANEVNFDLLKRFLEG